MVDEIPACLRHESLPLQWATIQVPLVRPGKRPARSAAGLAGRSWRQRSGAANHAFHDVRENAPTVHAWVAAGNDMALLRAFTSLVRSAGRAARPRLRGRRLVHGVAIAQAALFPHALLVRDEAAVGRPIASLLAPRIILSID